jgi:hypothetical protein
VLFGNHGLFLFIVKLMSPMEKVCVFFVVWPESLNNI